MGHGLTLTQRRDRFPKGLKKFCHHEKTLPGDKRARAMRFENPIVAISHVEATETSKAYTRTLVSFQSTGATNIQGVNNLPSCSLYVTTKTRGQGSNKRTWGIEQNEGRGAYLGLYWAIDSLDHMIKIEMIRYITWKFWHAPYQHFLAMGVVAAYDMYIECCEGELNQEWYIEPRDRMGFRDFRLALSEQMIVYDSKKSHLPGDKSFRAFTRCPKRIRDQDRELAYEQDGLTLENFRKAKAHTRLTPPRLCGDLTHIIQHLGSLEQKTGPGKCEVCGEPTYWKCTVCDKRLCVMNKKKFTGARCALTFHNDLFFGLARCDHCDLFGRTAAKWGPPGDNKIQSNVRRIGAIKRVIAEEGGMLYRLGGGDNQWCL